ncbi:MAG: Hsp70 family protein [Alphaproteobacteria bacterium]|nr:Hsp70 family protein [Alphaproteobacteria bacterium]
MTNACGLDFGTSNSAIGTVQGGVPRLAALERGGALFPSAIFFDFEQNRPLFGAAAIETYMMQVEGRLMRALKSILATKLVKESTFLKTQRITFEAVIGLFVAEMKTRAEAAIGQPLDAVVHGRPVHFVDGDEAADRFAEDTLKVIAERAGFRHVSFQYEPLAAARAYEAKVNAETLALICDIGGGTSDFSVIRLAPERRAAPERKNDILANFGIRLGGTDLDRHLSLEAAMPMLGLGSSLHTKNLPMPRQLFADLAHWPTINQLYTPEARRMVRELHADAVEPQKTARLKTVVEKQLGHRLALSVEAAKIALSAAPEAAIGMDFIEPGLAAPADRDRFDDAVAGERARLAAAVRETLTRAGVAPDSVGTVFLTGGSSRVPALRKAIASVVSPSKFAGGDDLLSVALGLTEEARLRYR